MQEQSQRLEEYVRDLLEDLYKGREKLVKSLSEHVTWIGEKESEVYEGMEEVRRHLNKKEKFPRCKMGEASFRVVWENKDAALIEGMYILQALEENGFMLKNRQRCSVLVEKGEKKTQIVHLHISDTHENIIWRKELISQIQRDPLTQIYNVRTVQEKVEQWLEEAEHKECTMCMIDVDNFKMINDNFGHMKGNDVLIQVAHILAHATGKEGYAGRVGGDEFLVFLKAGEEKRVQEFLSCLEQDIRSRKINSQIQVTVSIGAVRAVNDNISYKELFRQADAALYLAKGQGKNTVHVLMQPKSI